MRRDLGVDTLRGLMVLGVWFTHTVPFTTRHEVGALVFLDIAASLFLMPLAFGLAGFTAARTLDRPLGNSIRTRAERLLWPWLVWTMISLALIVLVEQKYSFSAMLLLKPLISPGDMGPTWFLLALFFFDLYARITRSIPSWANLALMAVMVTAIGLLRLPAPDLVVHIVPYLAGIWLGRSFPAALPVSPGARGAAAMALGAFLLWPAVFGLQVRISLELACVSAAGVLLLLLLRAVVEDLLGCRFLHFVGRNSLQLYLAHWPVVIGFRRLEVDGALTSAPVLFWATMLCSAFVGTLLTLLTRRSAAFALLFAWPTRSERHTRRRELQGAR